MNTEVWAVHTPTRTAYAKGNFLRAACEAALIVIAERPIVVELLDYKGQGPYSSAHAVRKETVWGRDELDRIWA